MKPITLACSVTPEHHMEVAASSLGIAFAIGIRCDDGAPLKQRCTLQPGLAGDLIKWLDKGKSSRSLASCGFCGTPTSLNCCYGRDGAGKRVWKLELSCRRGDKNVFLPVYLSKTQADELADYLWRAEREETARLLGNPMAFGL